MWSARARAMQGTLAAILVAMLLGCGGNNAPPSAAEDAALSAPAAGTQLAMLVPDGALLTDPRIVAWADAAWEEGVQITFVTDSSFLALGGNALKQYPGIILPDGVHSRASDALIQALTTYASAGGWLMLVYDFGALTADGFYAAPKSRLSDLAGVDYVFYDALRDRIVGLGSIAGKSSVLQGLQVPPGKSMPTTITTGKNALTVTAALVAAPLVASEIQTETFLPTSVSDPGGLAGYHHADQFETSDSLSAGVNQTTDVLTTPGFSSQAQKPSNPRSPPRLPLVKDLEAISGYVTGALTYPTYVTEDASGYQGTVLLYSSYGYVAENGSLTTSGIAAGQRSQGSGGVLFVNTPLSYLNGQTDGMLLHGFLRYFAASLLKRPRLSDHPDGRGGLVFNWHLDAAEALDPIQTLDNQKIWNEGPFSIHLTAGPDTIQFGDGLGLNVPGNPVTQSWIRYFLSKNHQVGSHGGWDHDLYGLNVTEFNADEQVPGTTNTFRDFLVLNKREIEAVTGRVVTEYSAPEGNNPIWAMNWLEANNNVGYYFTGHTGMGPTRAYRPPLDNPAVGKMLNPKMWAFPVTPFGKDATFEEFQEHGVAKADITKWHTALLDFVVKNHTSRLIYAHPPGAADYLDVMSSLLLRARQWSLFNQFRWYTMTDLAQFGAKRLQVSWVEKGNGIIRTFNAQHPTDLNHFTWILPRAAYSLPWVISGAAAVTMDNENWLVTAKGGTALKFVSVRFR